MWLSSPSSFETWQWAALVLAGAAAGFVNVVAGGGSLLSVPLLIFFGLPPTVANASSRVAILVQNAVATATYARAGRLDGPLTLRMAVPALVGGVVGAVLGTRFSDDAFQALFAWVMLGCAAWIALGARATAVVGPPRLQAGWTWPIVFGIGLYGGLVQAGVGYLILFGLVQGLRLPLIEANIQKVVLVLVYTPVVLAIFVWQGQVDWAAGIALSLGQALGGVLGARAALARGERLIRALLLIVVVASALKLLYPG